MSVTDVLDKTRSHVSFDDEVLEAAGASRPPREVTEEFFNRDGIVQTKEDSRRGAAGKEH